MRPRPSATDAAIVSPPTPPPSPPRRLKLADAENYVILPELISKEPLGLVVRDGDDKWFDIVRWTMNALIDAEELGITQENAVEEMRSPSPEVKRLLGVEGKFGSRIWALGGLGVARRPGRRQLRRDLRAQPRHGLALEAAARDERALVEGRHPLRAAHPLNAQEKPPIVQGLARQRPSSPLTISAKPCLHAASALRRGEASSMLVRLANPAPKTTATKPSAAKIGTTR